MLTAQQDVMMSQFICPCRHHQFMMIFTRKMLCRIYRSLKTSSCDDFHFLFIVFIVLLSFYVLLLVLLPHYSTQLLPFCVQINFDLSRFNKKGSKSPFPRFTTLAMINCWSFDSAEMPLVWFCNFYAEGGGWKW